MAITARLVDDRAVTTNATSYASDVPAAGSVDETHIAWVMSTHGTTATLPTLSGGGLTWTEVNSVIAGTNRGCTAFRARGTNTAAAITANFGATTQTGCIIIWLAFDGVDPTTDEGVVQSAVSAATGTSDDATLAAIGAGNAVASGASSNIGGDITAEDPPFTELSDVEYATPVHSGHAMWAVTTDTTPTHTAPSSSSWRIIAVELKAVSAGADATVTPAAITAPVSLPAPTGSAASTVSPASISSPVTIPQAALSAGSTMTPATIAALVGIPQASLSAQSVVTPATVPLVSAMPQATAGAAALVAPGVLPLAVGLPAPVASAGSTVLPGTVPLVVALPLPTASGVSSVIVAPAVIPLAIVLPIPSITVPETWRTIETALARAVTSAGAGTITPPVGGTVTRPGSGTVTPPTSPPITVP